MVGEKNPFLRIYEKNKIKLHSKIINSKDFFKNYYKEAGQESCLGKGRT